MGEFLIGLFSEKEVCFPAQRIQVAFFGRSEFE